MTKPKTNLEKTCEACGDTFLPTGHAQRFCAPCGKARRTKYRQLHLPRQRPSRDPWIRMQEELPCRRCGVKPGEQCVTGNDTFAKHPHKERYDDAGLTDSTDETDRIRWRASSADYKANKRARVFAHYGESCACCGNTENLTIDHIYGAGRDHRKTAGWSSHNFYTWLVRNDFPAGFQTLCAPCNNSKHTGDRCRLLHVPACPTCHRPFEEETAVDARGYRIWSQGGRSAPA